MELTAKDGYSKVLKLMNKYKDVCNFNIGEIRYNSEIHLFQIELKEKYGLDINPNYIRSLDWNQLGEYCSIAKYGGKYNRTISWPDDGRQPKDELLLEIGFSTGPYIFGQDYPKEFFQQFFNELKSYNPKYVDTANKCLYFSRDNASIIYNNFKNILQKYYDLNKEDVKQRKINKLKEELEKLEKSE